MSLEYCENCNEVIDTDFEAEHFLCECGAELEKGKCAYNEDLCPRCTRLLTK